MSVSIIVQVKKKKSDDQFGTIYIRGFYNRRPVAAVSTGQRIELKYWDPIKKELAPNAPNAKLINTVVQTKLQTMQSQLLKKEIMGSNINRNHVLSAVKNIDDSRDFYAFCTERIKQYPNEDTRRTYSSELTKIKKYRELISFADIDYRFLCGYKEYMEGIDNGPNTLWKTFKFLNTMLRTAIKVGGIIDCNPFDEFDRGKYTQGKRQWLEISECDAIEKLVAHHDEKIKLTAIYFLLMAYSGMRFSDAMLFRPDIHVINNERIIMNYKKAGTDVNIKMYDRLKRIVDLVRVNPYSTTNKSFNDWLKVIGGMCNITFNLSAHIGRHTMGALLAEIEIPEEQAQQILGHRDIKSTRIYYHLKNKSIDKAMDKMNSL